MCTVHKAELRKLLCSMLLGDGTIQKNNNSKNGHRDSYWFSFHHSMKQVDYAGWKKEQIDKFFEKKKVQRKSNWRISIPQYNRKTNRTYYSCRYRLYWSKYFRIFRKWVYRQDGTKRASFLLRHMENDKQLFMWFMDDGSEESQLNTHKDGSTYRTNPRLILHICDYTQRDAELMVNWFKEKYSVEPRIIYTSRNQGRKPRLRFVSTDVRKLFPRISVYVRQLESGKKKFSLCLERYC